MIVRFGAAVSIVRPSVSPAIRHVHIDDGDVGRIPSSPAKQAKRVGAVRASAGVSLKAAICGQDLAVRRVVDTRI